VVLVSVVDRAQVFTRELVAFGTEPDGLFTLLAKLGTEAFLENAAAAARPAAQARAGLVALGMEDAVAEVAIHPARGDQFFLDYHHSHDMALHDKSSSAMTK
jgi:hypothetical protein